jgi:hypothetical protein
MRKNHPQGWFTGISPLTIPRKGNSSQRQKIYRKNLKLVKFTAKNEKLSFFVVNRFWCLIFLYFTVNCSALDCISGELFAGNC